MRTDEWWVPVDCYCGTNEHDACKLLPCTTYCGSGFFGQDGKHLTFWSFFEVTSCDAQKEKCITYSSSLFRAVRSAMQKAAVWRFLSSIPERNPFKATRKLLLVVAGTLVLRPAIPFEECFRASATNLKEVSNALALGALEPKGLKELHHRLARSMVHNMTCSDESGARTPLSLFMARHYRGTFRKQIHPHL
jgi:hypothetical protein